MRWVRGVEWMPYQPRTFVTPAFPGYVSGHSTFSHAAARTLERLTGSPFFPGGLGEFVAEQNAYLEFEAGPSVEVRLQWATWRDAADQAGQSRIWGGIHVAADDYDGRVLGWQVGDEAGSWGARHVAGFQPLPTIGDPTNPIHGGALESDLEGEPGDPPVGDPGVLVGTGRTQWSALLQGDPLRWEGGPQGGHHVWAAMRIEAAVAAELDPAARQVLRTRFTVEWPEEDGEILAQAQRTGGWTEGADGSIELVGTFVPLLSTIDVNSLTGRTLKLRAQVTIDDDRTLSSHVHFRSLCCD